MNKTISQCVLGLLAGFCMLTDTPVEAQEKAPEEERIIYYKDGSVFRGRILSEDPLHLQLVLSTMDTISINKSMIGRNTTARRMSMHRRGGFHYKEGMYAYLTGMLGGGDDNLTGMTDLTLGYRIHPNRSVGIGAGLAISDIVLAGSWMTHEFTTIFLYGRQYLGKSKTRFYFDTRLGYGLPRASANVFGNEHNGGVHFQPGLGLHFASKSGLKWHIGVAQFVQRTSGEDITTGPFNQPIETEFKLWYHRTVFKLGIEIR